MKNCNNGEEVGSDGMSSIIDGGIKMKQRIVKLWISD